MHNGESAGNDAGLETLEIQVTGMTCDHCARRVERVLRGATGVTEVRVEWKIGRARVTFDGRKTALSELHRVLTKSGYPPGTSAS